MWLLVSRGRIRKVIRRIQSRAVPDFVKISVKLIRTGFGDVVDLRCPVPALIYRIGKGVHRHFRNRIHAQHKVGCKANIQVGEGVVGFKTINDVTIRGRGETVKLHVAVTIRTRDGIAAVARRIDQRARGKLQRVG